MTEIELKKKLDAAERYATGDYPPNAGGISALTVDHFMALGVRVPRSHVAIIGIHAKALLEDGFEWMTVAAAAVIAIRKGNPTYMQYVASDLVMASSGQRLTHKQYQKMLQDEMELRK